MSEIFNATAQINIKKYQIMASLGNLSFPNDTSVFPFRSIFFSFHYSSILIYGLLTECGFFFDNLHRCFLRLVFRFVDFVALLSSFCSCLLTVTIGIIVECSQLKSETEFEKNTSQLSVLNKPCIIFWIQHNRNE